MPAFKLYLLLLVLVALTVVVLLRVVGIILVIALLTIPAVISKKLARNLKRMMGIAILLSIIFGITGLAFSYYLNLASGATIVMVAICGFLIIYWFKRDK